MKTTIKQATSKTYREAARRIAEGENDRCCIAIADAMSRRPPVADKNDAPLFYELYYPCRDHWLHWWEPSDYFPDTQNYRVIALLLAAEIFDSEARGEYAYDIAETK